MRIEEIITPALREINNNARGHISDVYLVEGEPIYYYRLKEFIVPDESFIPEFKGTIMERDAVAAIAHQCWEKNKTRTNRDTKDSVIRGTFTFDYNDDWRIRANIATVYPKRMTICLRLISRQIASFDDLKLPQTLMHLALDNPAGLIIISGPTGSGKTTTIAALIESIMQHRNSHIATLEQHVEYVFKQPGKLVTQQTVGAGADVGSFHDGLQSLLYDKVDTVMIGELRDLDTVQAALQLAGSHLVLATTHHTKAFKVLEYLVHMYPGTQHEHSRSLLLDCLLAVSCQTLLPGTESSVSCLVPVYDLMINTPELKKSLEKKEFSHLPDLMRETKECVVWQDRMDALYKNGSIEYEVFRSYSDKNIDLTDHGAALRPR